MSVHVTQALSVLGRGFEYVPPALLAEKARIGTEVHRHALAAIKGLYLPAPPDVKPYVDKVLEWHEDHIVEVLDIEIEVSIPDIGVVGRSDLLAKYRGDRAWTVIDLKRVNHVPAWVGLQLAAYQRGLERKYPNRKIRRRIALKVPDDGPCVGVEFKDHELDYLCFFYSVIIHKHLGGNHVTASTA